MQAVKVEEHSSKPSETLGTLLMPSALRAQVQHRHHPQDLSVQLVTWISGRSLGTDDVSILFALATSLLGGPKALIISADAFTNHTMTVVPRAQTFSALQPASFQKSAEGDFLL